MASHVEDCLISLERTAVVMGERTPPPPTSVSSKTELIFYPVFFFFFEGMQCKEKLSEHSAKTIHYGKICSLVTSRDKAGSWQIGSLGSKHVMHRLSRMGRRRGDLSKSGHACLRMCNCNDFTP